MKLSVLFLVGLLLAQGVCFATTGTPVPTGKSTRAVKAVKKGKAHAVSGKTKKSEKDLLKQEEEMESKKMDFTKDKLDLQKQEQDQRNRDAATIKILKAKQAPVSQSISNVR